MVRKSRLLLLPLACAAHSGLNINFIAAVVTDNHIGSSLDAKHRQWQRKIVVMYQVFSSHITYTGY
jgi:hypothetical protein